MAQTQAIAATEQLADPMRPDNGVPRMRAAVERSDYGSLEPTLVPELDLAFFGDRYAVAGPAGQRVLDEMAGHSGCVSAHEIRRALPETPKLDQIVARLLERALIYRPSAASNLTDLSREP